MKKFILVLALVQMFAVTAFADADTGERRHPSGEGAVRCALMETRTVAHESSHVTQGLVATPAR